MIERWVSRGHCTGRFLAANVHRRALCAILVAWCPCWLVQPWVCRDLRAASPPHTDYWPQAAVVSVARPATEVGIEILRRGGNAVDAAVAVAFALAVTYPEAGNIAGGGFMMVWPAKKGSEAFYEKASDPFFPVCIGYRETAPAAATRTMYRAGESTYTHRAVGVPGTVRGLALAHKRYGKLPWKDLVAPAVKLAAEGFAVDRAVAASLNKILRDSPDKEELQRAFRPVGGESVRRRLGDKQNSAKGFASHNWQAGDSLVQPELAATLSTIAEQGPDAFYTGPIAAQIVAEMRRGGGLITAEDLARYEARVRPPIRITYRGYDIYAPPLPSSGGICLAQMLGVLERFDLAKSGRNSQAPERHRGRSLQRWSADTLHIMVEAMRRAYCDRARYLGDADFVKIPDRLTTKEYAAKLAASIDLRRATRSETIAPEIRLAAEQEHTTHFCVVDPQGMAVSNTYTLEDRYGSRIMVRGAGFLLNNEMGDFNWRPGVTDRRGTIGTEPNTIAPRKRMLSSMTPVIVARDGKPVLLTGSPGGRTIPSTVLQVIVNVIDFEMPLAEAVAAPRLHHGWFPDEIRFEGSDDPKFAAVVEELKRRGHRFCPQAARQGDAHSIRIGRDRLEAAADLRISGHAAGF